MGFLQHNLKYMSKGSAMNYALILSIEIVGLNYYHHCPLHSNIADWSMVVGKPTLNHVRLVLEEQSDFIKEDATVIELTVQIIRYVTLEIA